MSTWWIWLILAVLVLAGVGVLTYFLLRHHGTPTPTPTPIPIPTPPGTPTPPPGTPTPPPGTPTPPPGTPCPQYYSIPNVNFGGNDLVNPYTVQSEQACQSLCTVNQNCMFYNYEAGKNISDGGKCWIKYADRPPGFQLGFAVPSTPGVSCPRFMEFLGAEISDKKVGNPNPYSGGSMGQCQNTCNEIGCHFYTYDTDENCTTYQFGSDPGTNTGVNLAFASPTIPAGNPIY